MLTNAMRDSGYPRSSRPSRSSYARDLHPRAGRSLISLRSDLSISATRPLSLFAQTSLRRFVRLDSDPWSLESRAHNPLLGYYSHVHFPAGLVLRKSSSHAPSACACCSRGILRGSIRVAFVFLYFIRVACIHAIFITIVSLIIYAYIYIFYNVSSDRPRRLAYSRARRRATKRVSSSPSCCRPGAAVVLRSWLRPVLIRSCPVPHSPLLSPVRPPGWLAACVRPASSRPS